MESDKQLLGDNKKSVIHRRKWLTLEEKLKIIDDNDNGKTSGNIAREHNMNESSVRLILRKKEFYKSLGKSPTFHRLKSFAQQRSSLLGEVERLLLFWIDEHNQKSIHLTEAEIQKKALELFNGLKLDYGVTTKFSASRGWLRRFKKRIYVRKCIESMEKLPTVEEAADQFRTEFQKIVKENGYSHHQIFNVEETVLFWKKMPCSNFDSDFEKNQPSTDKLSLVLGSNATGDFKLKPLVIYCSETPFAVENWEKDSLPVMWKWNKKSWLTQELFQEWFTSYFCPAVEQYCTEHGLEFKALLVLDPTCSHNLIHPHPNIRIIFLPKNISKHLQPMNLGIFPLLKAHYQRLISQNIVDSPDQQNFWFQYNIKNAIENIYRCWVETDAENLAATWHQLLPDVKPKDFESLINAVAQEVINIDQQLGINTDMQNFQHYLDLSLYETPDQYTKFEEVICKAETPDAFEYEEECDGEPNLEDLRTIIQSIDTACEVIMMSDANIERSIKAKQCLQEGIRCYREMCLKRTKQKSYNDNMDV